MTSNNSPENLFVKSSLPEEQDKPVQVTAGELLRRAREDKNLDLATLAATLKVSEAKLRSLEANDFANLPAMAFTRGFAKSVCKRLGIDEKPVLDLLPGLHSSKPSDYAVDLTQPLHSNAMKDEFGRSGRSGGWWLLLIVLIIVLLALFFMPKSWKNSVFPDGKSDNQNTTTQEVLGENSSVQATTLVVPALSVPASNTSGEQRVTSENLVVTDLSASPIQENTTAIAGDVANGHVQEVLPVEPVLPPPSEEIYFSAKGGNTSITVRGNDNRVIMTRTLNDGEELVVPLEKMPLKVNVGSVKFTTVKLRGQGFDLQPHTKRNTANFEVN